MADDNNAPLTGKVSGSGRQTGARGRLSAGAGDATLALRRRTCAPGGRPKCARGRAWSGGQLRKLVRALRAQHVRAEHSSARARSPASVRKPPPPLPLLSPASPPPGEAGRLDRKPLLSWAPLAARSPPSYVKRRRRRPAASGAHWPAGFSCELGTGGGVCSPLPAGLPSLRAQYECDATGADAWPPQEQQQPGLVRIQTLHSSHTKLARRFEASSTCPLLAPLPPQEFGRRKWPL